MPNNLLRKQAQRCRALAAKTVKDEIRQGLLDMATEFDHLADELEAKVAEQLKDGS